MKFRDLIDFYDDLEIEKKKSKKSFGVIKCFHMVEFCEDTRWNIIPERLIFVTTKTFVVLCFRASLLC